MEKDTKNNQPVKVAIGVFLLFVLLLLILFFFLKQPKEEVVPEATTPEFEVEEIATGIDHPWDIGFLPDGRIIFTERSGEVSIINGEEIKTAVQVKDVFAEGEGGLMGLAVDPKFSETNRIYTCSNISRNGEIDVRVLRWELIDGELTRSDGLLRFPSSESGRHSGCQLEFGPDGYLYIGTGDAATGSLPQDPANYGGKILRVDDRGKAVTGNLEAPFDPKIFSYGHRNTQGITFLKTTSSSVPVGLSTEHGPDVNDEINLIQMGNYGWDPIPDYNEAVPMTDKTKYPEAIEAVWTSGDSTLAISGLTQITGEVWGLWDGAIAVAALKGERVLILQFTGEKLEEVATILTDIGRVRTIQQGADESLYVLTDNGNSSDKIIKLTPK